MNNKKNFFFVSCEEAQHICDKMQYGEATLLDKIKLSCRLIWCNATKSYSKRNATLTQLCKEAEIKTMDPKKKQELKKKLNADQSEASK
ncbi:hypothetical protein JM658_13710 [Joostella atrarenae]|uniref:Uncharacterized protein n=1 Tax=Joostella atrarenae TaxID=679257 RepID=A0ABS9J635_9FLAO|nr:hypothetical protein [Joostella atrarenae]MCF8715887.1 hypothetical protein [Joostella atrarenae]